MSMLQAFNQRKRLQARTDTTTETGEHSHSTNSSQPEQKTEDSKQWPSQQKVLAFVQPERIGMLRNPVIVGVIKQQGGELGQLLQLLEIAQTDPTGLHDTLHSIYTWIGEALAADHGEHGSALPCASSTESRESIDFRHDGSRQNDSGGHAPGSLALTLYQGQSAHSGLEASLPGSVGAHGTLSEALVHEVGAE